MTKTVNVAVDFTTRANFNARRPGRITVTPTSIAKTVTVAGTATQA